MWGICPALQAVCTCRSPGTQSSWCRKGTVAEVGGADGFVVCCVFPLEFLRKILKNPRIGCSDKPDTFPEGTIHSSAAKKRHSSDSPGGACGGDGGSCCRARTRVA